MTTAELRDRVTSVIDMAGDYERAHGMEDKLMREWIQQNVSHDALKQFDRMWEADFPRYCA